MIVRSETAQTTDSCLHSDCQGQYEIMFYTRVHKTIRYRCTLAESAMMHLSASFVLFSSPCITPVGQALMVLRWGCMTVNRFGVYVCMNERGGG